MNVIIVAGGNGTRFRQLSVFPKILLPCETYNSILESHMSAFSGEKIYLIINSRYYYMVVDYCKVNKINNITIIPTDNSNGSFNSIMSLRDRLPSEDCLFVWSDIVVNGLDKCHENTIYTIDGDYRYRACDGTIENVGSGGNIPGVYYFRTTPDEPVRDKETDLVDFIIEDISKGGTYATKEISSLTEYRDLNTYYELYKSVNDGVTKPRFFNQLTNNGDGTLTKRCIDDAYAHLIRKELAWYDRLGASDYTPEIYSGTEDKQSFTMEYLEGYMPLYRFIEKNSNNNEKVYDMYMNLKRCIEELGADGKERDVLSFRSDLYTEVVQKVIDRCSKIEHMLINYDRARLSDTLMKAYSKLSEYAGDNVRYVFGHGDMNGSNVMVNDDCKIKLIDPRGYFGDSKMYIWGEYEIAKILYCISGYDNFNNGAMIYGTDTPTMYATAFECADRVFGFNKAHFILLYVIWIALAGYISQDILKANIAYEYGLSKLGEILNDE